MTISSEISKAGPYLGNGSTTVFPYGFKILDEKHIVVVVMNANFVITTLSLVAGDYTVTGVGSETGGTIIKATPLLTGQKLSMVRRPEFTQETSLENQGAYYPEVVENRFDVTVMQIQALKEGLERAVSVPVGETRPDIQNIFDAVSESAALLEQVRDVAEGIDVDAFLKSNELVPDLNLRSALRPSNQIFDANNHKSPGWAIGQNALNAPTNTGADDWYAYSFTGDGVGATGEQRAISYVSTYNYIRFVRQGVWSAWSRDYVGNEQDARFLRFWPDTSTSPYATQRIRVGLNTGAIEALIPGSENNGWANFFSPIGRAGSFHGSISSMNPTVGDSGTYASGHFVINDSNKEAWIQYSEGRVDAGAGGLCGHEINVISKKTLIPNDPYNIYAPHSVTAQILSSGRPDVAGGLPLSSYLNIQHNGAAADKGINIGSTAVTVKSGHADAINLAKNHAIQQWAASGFKGAGIRFDVVDSTQSLLQIFGDSFVKWRLRDAGLDALLLTTTLLTSYVPIKFPSFTKAAKPSASAMGAGATIYISNDTSNRRLATSDGTDWRFQDGTVVPAS